MDKSHVSQGGTVTTRGSGVLIFSKAELCFAATVAAYLVFYFHYGRFEVTDELFFKAAGKNWAETGHFNAPELTGSLRHANLPTPVEQVFFLQPPLYPFLFGVFVKFFGFGWRQCVMYDAMIHVGLMLTTFLLAKTLFSRVLGSEMKTVPLWVRIVPALMTMPLIQAGRPDELAMALGMAGLLLLLRDLSVTRIAVSAAFFGFSCATSAGASIELGLVVSGLIFLSNASVREKIKYAAIWVLFCTGTLSLLLSPILIKYPAAYRQYLNLTQKYLFKMSPSALSFAFQFGKPYFFLISAALCVAACGLWARVGLFGVRSLASLWLGTLSAIIFALYALPGKYTYLWFILPVLMTTAFVSALYVVRYSGRNGLRLVFVMIALFALSAYAWSVRDVLVLIGLNHEQRPEYNEQRLKEIMPAGAGVALQSGWWFLSNRVNAYDAMFSNKKDLSDIDYIILSATGSGTPGQPQPPANPRYRELLSEKFEPMYDNLPTGANKILGLPLSRSGNGFGVIVYKRRHSGA